MPGGSTSSSIPSKHSIAFLKLRDTVPDIHYDAGSITADDRGPGGDQCTAHLHESFAAKEVSKNSRTELLSIHWIDGSVKRLDEDLLWARCRLLELSRQLVGSARLGDDETLHLAEAAEDVEMLPVYKERSVRENSCGRTVAAG